MSDERDDFDSEMVALLPMQWTPLGDSGIEVLAGPANGFSIPLRYRTRHDEPAVKPNPNASKKAAK